MGNAGSIWVKLGLDSSGFDNGLKKAEKDLKGVSNRLMDIGSRLTLGLSVPLGLVSGAALKMGADAVESENLFSVSMGKMADSARAWSEQLRKNLGLNAYEVRKNVGTFNVMLGSMGMTEKAAYDMSKGLTQLAYDMASFYNLS
ncbi:MAG TPA: phage tail tape measure protein, partial [Bacillota bacterium]|nr:phage tail tape measure protein [Bacillota bacterium]